MKGNQTAPIIKKLRQIVLDNLNNEQFGVQDLSDTYGLSRSQLHKKLKKQTGKSVSQFIREVRLEEAKKLLEQEDVTASEVAYQVGFSSATYFNTRFKDYFGYPPGEVRMRLTYEKEHPKNIFNDAAKPKGFRKTYRQKWLVGGVGLSLLVIVGYFFFKNFNTPRNTLETANQNFDMADSISNEKTIAVLPLKNWSGDPDLEYISDGMTDAIIIKLAKIGAIGRVVPFTSMMAYKNTEKSIKEIASELNVNNILQGSFQLAGDQVRVKLQMIDGGTENQFWENEYRRTWKTNEIFELQSEVAENIARIINVQISDREQESIEVIPTSNKRAYSIYLQAEYQFNQLNSEGFEKAAPLFKKAIALDSMFVEPYVGLANFYKTSGLVWGVLPEQEAWTRAKPYYKKALAIDQKKSRTYHKSIVNQLLTGSFYYEWDFGSIEKNYVDSEDYELISGIRDGYYVDYARKTGRFEDALALSDILIEKSPIYGGAYAAKSYGLYFLNRKDEAKELLAKFDAVFESDYYYLTESAKIYYYLGATEESKLQLEIYKSQFPDRPPIIFWLDAIHAEMEDKPIRVKEILATLKELYNQNVSGSPAWFLALYYCHVKDFDRAFEWLRKSYDNRETEMTWLKEEPVLRPLKNDPRYLELYEKVGFPIVDQSMEKQKIRP